MEGVDGVHIVVRRVGFPLSRSTGPKSLPCTLATSGVLACVARAQVRTSLQGGSIRSSEGAEFVLATEMLDYILRNTRS